MNDALTDQVHALWDELADFDASQTDAAFDHLLAGLCRLVDAQNACWLGAVRLADVLPNDPVRGWRVRCYHYLHPAAQLDASIKAQIKNLDHGSVDVNTIRNAALAGTFRVNRAEDLTPGWLESDYCQRYFKAVGRADAMWAGIPINDDAECHFGIFRDDTHPRFTPQERDLVGYALRSLKWFCRRQMLSHGLTVASSPLTATERDVLGELLSGQAEKLIAADLGQSYHTTHEHIANLFRKFGVHNRAALMALWIGKAA